MAELEAGAATPLREIVRGVVSVPTASYLEHGVREHIRAFAEDRGLEYAEDEYGNAYVRYQRGRVRRPLVLGAHMDHPGFVVRTVVGRRLELEFHGGVAASYGVGERLRLYAAESLELQGTATITRVRGERGRIAAASARLEPGAIAAAGDLALWDVPVCTIRGETVRARQCDDLAGVAAILSALDRAVAGRVTGTLIGLFTRAEEVGLRGAVVTGRARLLPDDALVVAVETSSMAGGRAVQGAGPIIRVGDAIHIFSPRMTQWMTALAQEIAAVDRSFRFQRKLMDGGVTEATAYDLYGYETGAACVALGNYHNAGPGGRIAAETVRLDDIDGLVRLFLRMLETVPQVGRYLPALLRRFDGLGREAAARLRRR